MGCDVCAPWGPTRDRDPTAVRALFVARPYATDAAPTRRAHHRRRARLRGRAHPDGEVLVLDSDQRRDDLAIGIGRNGIRGNGAEGGERRARRWRVGATVV